MSFTFRGKLGLIPAAVLCAAGLGASAANAQSSVQIYGVLDVNVGSYADSAATVARSSQVASGKLTTSFIGFKGTEDLGGGLSAFFVLETHVRVDSGDSGRSAADPFFSRNSYMGLKDNKLGTLSLGRINTPLWLSSLSTNPLGASMGFAPGMRLLFGPAGVGKTAADGVWNNSIAYTSPVWGGFSGMVQHQLKENAAGGNTGFNLNYNAGGKFVLSIAGQETKAVFTSGKETTGFVGASYNFGVARVFGQYSQVKETATGTATADTKDKIYQVGVSIPLPDKASTIMASYADAKTSGRIEGHRKMFTALYDYRISKRTDVYAAVMTDKFLNYQRGNTYAVGVRHAF